MPDSAEQQNVDSRDRGAMPLFADSLLFRIAPGSCRMRNNYASDVNVIGCEPNVRSLAFHAPWRHRTHQSDKTWFDERGEAAEVLITAVIIICIGGDLEP
jgi:hypothetical protein